MTRRRSSNQSEKRKQAKGRDVSSPSNTTTSGSGLGPSTSRKRAKSSSSVVKEEPIDDIMSPSYSPLSDHGSSGAMDQCLSSVRGMECWNPGTIDSDSWNQIKQDTGVSNSAIPRPKPYQRSSRRRSTPSSVSSSIGKGRAKKPVKVEVNQLENNDEIKFNHEGPMYHFDSFTMEDTQRSSQLNPTISNVAQRQQHQQWNNQMLAICSRFRHFIRLPKAYRWVICEFFYGDIDRVCLITHDFKNHLKDTFPGLTTTNLRKPEWTKIRRTMGKPRRLSPAFLAQERGILCGLRDKVRKLQQRVLPDGFITAELPEEIPLRTVVGTQVSALITEGIFTGKVTGVDVGTYSYRIDFGNLNLGIRSVPDYCVMSDEPVEYMKITSLALKVWGYGVKNSDSPQQHIPDMTQTQLGNIPGGLNVDGFLGGFPIRFLNLIVRLSRTLEKKYNQLGKLRALNSEAEKTRCYGKPYAHSFRWTYANAVVGLDKINQAIQILMEEIYKYMDFLCDQKKSVSNLINPDKAETACNAEAASIVRFFLHENPGKPKRNIKNQEILNLITRLSSLLLQFNSLTFVSGTPDMKPRPVSDYQCMFQTLSQIKSSLMCPKSVRIFRDKVELVMRRMIAGASVNLTQEVIRNRRTK